MLSVNMRSASELTKAVNLLPVKPTYFGGIGLFEEKGSRTTSVTLDVPARPLCAGAQPRPARSRDAPCRAREQVEDANLPDRPPAAFGRTAA